jgi:hypothetical protein
MLGLNLERRFAISNLFTLILAITCNLGQNIINGENKCWLQLCKKPKDNNVVCIGSVTKLVQSHGTKDCQPSNQVLMDATPNNPIQIIVIYQPPWTMDMFAIVKQILQEVSNGVV